MIQKQFEHLKNLRQGLAYKDYEIVHNKIIKTFYFRSHVNEKKGVIEKQHEFYIEGENITEKITQRETEIAIFSKNMFVLPEGCSFGDPIKEEYKHYDNAVELAYRFGIEFVERVEKRSTLHKVKWTSLPEIVKEIEYILLQGAGYRIVSRKADTAFFSFQDEYYLITHSHQGYKLCKRNSEAQMDGELISIYKTAMDLVLSVGTHKLQFGISDNGGD